MIDAEHFPEQQKSFSQKNVAWRKKCVDWGANRSYLNYSPVRKTVRSMKINQDLINGIIHMDDMQAIINPSGTDGNFIPTSIQHYPIINSKLTVLQGEESKRTFDWKVVVTNPNSISEIENNKRNALFQRVQEIIHDSSMSEEEFQQELEKAQDFFSYEWQDIREMRANALLKHYSMEYDMPTMFNHGFMDAMKFGEEIYQIDIVGGEPVVEKRNPMKVRVWRNGYSNHIEDADIIVLEDFWSPGKIYDHYYDVLKPSDMKHIEEMAAKTTNQGAYDSAGNFDERAGFIHRSMVSDVFEDADGEGWVSHLFNDINGDTLMPYDMNGNIRVIQVFWKSRRKIKQIKSYDQATGETQYTFYPETYVARKELGEEEKTFWINEAWEGTLIGEDIYVNMRPRVVQYNRLSNPSRCHFGIIGTIYNKNDDRPYSLVDIMKPYSYFYDAVHDRLNKKIQHNWGKLINLDLALVPKGWDIDKWMYYAVTNGLCVRDSFKEGTQGVARGKLAGGMNNASSGVIDAEVGNSIQMDLQTLEFIKGEMGEVVGITRQREGQISNRETVGGVERATLQSSHSTEWLFIPHDNTKKRVYEALLEAAKIALRGRKKKFQYLLSDGQQAVMEIDGDEFAESDYGLLIDNGNETQKLNQQVDTLAQAAIQNQYSLSTIMRLYTSNSIMEKIRTIEHEEKTRQEMQQQQQQQQMQIQQQQIQQQAETAKAKMEQEYLMHQEDNETKILVAEINSKAEADRLAMMNGDDDGVQPMSDTDRAKLKETMRQFDAKMRLEKEKLEVEKKKVAKQSSNKK